jgi:hypothetical protein
MAHMLFCMAALVVTAPGGVAATTVHVEAEFFTDSHDYAGDLIAVVPSPSCSGGLMLIGLDHTGEWTEYAMSMPDTGTYSATMKCRGDYGVPYHFLLVVSSLRSSLSQTVDFTFTGNGYG